MRSLFLSFSFLTTGFSLWTPRRTAERCFHFNGFGLLIFIRCGPSPLWFVASPASLMAKHTTTEAKSPKSLAFFFGPTREIHLSLWLGHRENHPTPTYSACWPTLGVYDWLLLIAIRTNGLADEPDRIRQSRIPCLFNPPFNSRRLIIDKTRIPAAQSLARWHQSSSLLDWTLSFGTFFTLEGDALSKQGCTNVVK